jgi:hypothetical protein
MSIDTIEELALVVLVAVLGIVAFTGAVWLHRRG